MQPSNRCPGSKDAESDNDYVTGYDSGNRVRDWEVGFWKSHTETGAVELFA